MRASICMYARSPRLRVQAAVMCRVVSYTGYRSILFSDVPSCLSQRSSTSSRLPLLQDWHCIGWLLIIATESIR